MNELVQQLLDLKVRLSRWSKWWLASDLVSNAAFTIQAQQARIAELEAQRIQARYALEKCRMWNGSGYDWHPTHAKRAWEILGGGEK